MPFVYTQITTTIEFDDPTNEERKIVLRVSNAQDEVEGIIAVASEKRVNKVQRIKFVRSLLRPRDYHNEISLHDALRFVEHCEVNPYH